MQKTIENSSGLLQSFWFLHVSDILLESVMQGIIVIVIVGALYFFCSNLELLTGCLGGGGKTTDGEKLRDGNLICSSESDVSTSCVAGGMENQSDVAKEQIRGHLQNCLDLLGLVTNTHDCSVPSNPTLRVNDTESSKRNLTASLKIGQLKRILPLLSCYLESVPYLGFILTGLTSMIPEEESTAVADLLQNLNEQIYMARNDIKEILESMNWEALKLQYCNIVGDIQTGMKYVTIISNPGNNDKTDFEERLKGLCSNETMTKAVNGLLIGLTGEGMLHSDILEASYRHAGGHKKLFVQMCSELLKLLSGGLAVISVYETLVRGRKGSAQMMAMFDVDVQKLQTRVETYLERYEDELRNNMCADLNSILAGDKSNKDAAMYLSKFLREKYYWLENYCIVCNESIFIDYDFRGDHVRSHGNGNRFGVIFYRETPQSPTFRKCTRKIPKQDNALSEIRQIIRCIDDTFWYPNAAKINSVLKARLSSSGFTLWGCATVKTVHIGGIITSPLMIFARLVGSYIAQNGFETSLGTNATSEAAVFDIRGGKNLSLISRHEKFT